MEKRLLQAAEHGDAAVMYESQLLDSRYGTKSNQRSRDRRGTTIMSAWVVPPIVIPILIGVGLALLVAVRAFQ